MPRPFEQLRETLLRAGVAPRHVRRYARELEEHLDDLIAMQKERGFDDDDATARARALIGPDEELAAAMIARPGLRSLAARAPWLIFGLAPPLLVVALLASVGLMMLGVWTALPVDHHAAPGWAYQLAAVWSSAANVAAGPLAAAFFVVIAFNQRQNWGWPLFAVAVTALFGALTVFIVRLPHGDKLGEIGVGLSANADTLWQNGARVALTLMVVTGAWALLRRKQPS